MSNPDSKPAPDSLRRIADILGVPIASFVSCDEGVYDETAKLLHLWHAIGDSRGRRRILDLARREADRSTPEAGR